MCAIMHGSLDEIKLYDEETVDTDYDNRWPIDPEPKPSLESDRTIL